MSISIQEENRIFNNIWADLTSNNEIKATDSPKGYVLGGQPGAGKSNLISLVEMENKGNVLVVNGDEFRKYHPQFNEIQEKYGKDAPKHTAEFAGKMTGRVIEKALENKFNLVVEGTFRTAETPLKTLSDMKQKGYSTSVYIIATSAEVSWNGTLERYAKMLAAGEAPRYTDKAHHDKVVAELPKNADTVFQSGKADNFRVYSRSSLVYDKERMPNQLPSKAITNELHPKKAEKFSAAELFARMAATAAKKGEAVTIHKPVEQAQIKPKQGGEAQAETQSNKQKPKL
ncbi:TPA: zeta toxin family protein [Neisseria meningitidis]|nr:zeta toxin family protein [Neisseria meningitidis]